MSRIDCNYVVLLKDSDMTLDEQKVYDILTNNDYDQSNGRHWEGIMAERIVNHFNSILETASDLGLILGRNNTDESYSVATMNGRQAVNITTGVTPLEAVQNYINKHTQR